MSNKENKRKKITTSPYQQELDRLTENADDVKKELYGETPLETFDLMMNRGGRDYLSQQIRLAVENTNGVEARNRLTLAEINADNDIRYSPYLDIDYGESKFDKPLFSDSQIANTNEYRAISQSGFALIGLSLVKMTGNAATTFIDNIVGGVAGIMYGIADTNGKGFLYNFTNNPISKKLNQFNEWLDKVMPTYLTEEYQRNEENGLWWKNLGKSAWWGNQIKSAGFMVGMAASASVASMGISKTLGTLSLRNVLKGAIRASDDPAVLQGMLKSAKSIDDIASILKMNAKLLKYDNVVNQALSGVLSAAGEARLESILATNEYANNALFQLQLAQNEEILKLDLEFYTEENYKKGYFVTTTDQYGRELHILTTKGRVIYELRKQQIINNIQKGYSELSNSIKTMSNTIFGLNMAILSASNTLALNKMLGSGFRYDNSMYGLVRTETNKEIEKKYGKLYLNNLLKQEAKGAKGLRKYVGKGNVKDLIQGISSPIREGTEELLQLVASSGSQYRAESKLNEFSNTYLGYKLFENANDHSVSFLNSMAKGFNEAYSAKGFEEFVGGALISLIPLPFVGFKMKRVKDENGKFKKLEFKWNNELYKSFGDYARSKKRSTEIVEQLNKSIDENRIIKSIEYLSANELLLTEKEHQLSNGDKFGVINTETKEIINLINLYNSAGKIEDLRDLISYYANLKMLSEEEQQKAYEDIINATTSQDGNSPYSNMSKKELIDKVSDRNRKILLKLNDYVETMDSIYGLYGNVEDNELKDDFVEELTYITTNIKDYESRFTDIVESCRDRIKKIGLSTDAIKQIFSGYKPNEEIPTDKIKLRSLFYYELDKLDDVNLLLFSFANAEVLEAISNDIEKINGLVLKNRISKDKADKIINDLKDLPRIIAARKKYIETFNTLASNPIVFTKQFEEQLKKREEEANKKLIDNKILELNQLTSLLNFQQFYSSIESLTDELKKAILPKLEESNNQYVKKYLFINLLLKKIQDIVNNRTFKNKDSVKFLTDNLKNILNEALKDNGSFIDKKTIIEKLNNIKQNVPELFKDDINDIINDIVEKVNNQKKVETKNLFDEPLNNEQEETTTETDNVKIQEEEILSSKNIYNNIKQISDDLDLLFNGSYSYGLVKEFLERLINNFNEISKFLPLDLLLKDEILKYVHLLLKSALDLVSESDKSDKKEVENTEETLSNLYKDTMSRPNNPGSSTITKYDTIALKNTKNDESKKIRRRQLTPYKINSITDNAKSTLDIIHGFIYGNGGADDFIASGKLEMLNRKENGKLKIYYISDGLQKLQYDSNQTKFCVDVNQKQVFYAIEAQPGIQYDNMQTVHINGTDYFIIGTVGPISGKTQYNKIVLANKITTAVNNARNKSNDDWQIMPNKFTYIDTIFTGRTVLTDDTHAYGFRKINKVLDYDKFNIENIKLGVVQDGVIVGLDTGEDEYVGINENKLHNEGSVYLYVKTADGKYYPWKCERVSFGIGNNDLNLLEYVNSRKNDNELIEEIKELFRIILDDKSSLHEKLAAKVELNNLIYLGKNSSEKRRLFNFDVDATGHTNGITITNYSKNKGDSLLIINGRDVEENVRYALMRLQSLKSKDFVPLLLVKKSKLLDNNYRKQLFEKGNILTDLLYFKKFESSFTVSQVDDELNIIEDLSKTDVSAPKLHTFDYNDGLSIVSILIENGSLQGSVTVRLQAVFRNVVDVGNKGYTKYCFDTELTIWKYKNVKNVEQITYKDKDTEHSLYVFYDINNKYIGLIPVNAESMKDKTNLLKENTLIDNSDVVDMTYKIQKFKELVELYKSSTKTQKDKQDFYIKTIALYSSSSPKTLFESGFKGKLKIDLIVAEVSLGLTTEALGEQYLNELNRLKEDILTVYKHDLFKINIKVAESLIDHFSKAMLEGNSDPVADMQSYFVENAKPTQEQELKNAAQNLQNQCNGNGRTEGNSRKLNAKGIRQLSANSEFVNFKAKNTKK